jgi:KipI family sensor histidine kinase inhibitor
VHALAAALEAAPPPGLGSLTPGYSSLLVQFDPLLAEPEPIAAAIRDFVEIQLQAAVERPPGRLRQIPTVYGGDCGPDLERVARRLGLSPAEVVSRHTAAEQTVYMIGFAPGFPYLGDLPPELALPRRATPRERVPAGSVAIAGRQTGIYPRSTPGGWHLLGRTPLLLFDATRDPPAYLRPGDRVRFVAIEPSDWDRFAGPAADW